MLLVHCLRGSSCIISRQRSGRRPHPFEGLRHLQSKE